MSDKAGAISAHREAIDILMASDTTDVASRRQLVQALHHLEAPDQTKQVLQFAQNWLVRDSKKNLAALLAANAYLRIGELMLRASDQSGCLQNLRLAISTLEAAPEKTPEWQKTAALAYARLSEAQASLARDCGAARSAAERSRTIVAGWNRLPRDRSMIDQIIAVSARCAEAPGQRP
jgi:hypothetical protein